MEMLCLETNHSGPTEICSLFLLPDYRKHGHGRLLSLHRFLFIKEFSSRFEQEIISEMRGVSAEDGKSPFWESVGRHFFKTDYNQADLLSGLGNKAFIKNLMPRHPIYIELLPQDVQKVIGKVHDKTKPALKLLEGEGFVYQQEVDIFDAGPTVAVKLEEIRTVKEAKQGKVVKIEPSLSGDTLLVSNTELDFRACLGVVQNTKDGFVISEEVAGALDIAIGDDICSVSLR